MSDPIPAIAKKLYRVWCEGQPSMPPWDGLTGERQNCWVQVASAACIAALGSDHLVNALREERAEKERLTAENKKLTYLVDMAANDLRALRIAGEALQEIIDLDGKFGCESVDVARQAIKEMARSDSGK